MFCIACLGCGCKIAIAVGKPVCNEICKNCLKGSSKLAEDELSHDAQFISCVMVNACAVVWEFFYFAASIRSYNYRALLSDQQDSYENWTGLLLIWMLIFNGWSAGTLVQSHNNSHRVFLSLKMLLIFSITIGLWLVPLVAVPLAWKSQFKDSCDEFGTRVYLDSKTTKPAGSVEFDSRDPVQKYTMEFLPNPQESNDDYNVFSLDPHYVPGSSVFIPTYDTVHYNLTAMTWTTKLYNTPIRNGSFELLPVLHIPELEVIADTKDFAFSETYEPFLKLYSTAKDEKILEKKQGWANNTDVIMRTVKYSRTDRLQVCARELGDAIEGLGEMTPVPIGLMILLRARRMPLKSPDDGQL